MAAVRILRPPLCGDSAAQVPREQWPQLIEERQRSCQAFLHTDCRLLLFFVKDGAENGWLGYADREAYLRDGLQLDPDLVAWALEGLRKADPAGAVPFDEAVVLGRRGGDRRSEAAKEYQGNNVTLKERGNATDYTVARLRRDQPELAERVIKGELSANAAAIQAGFRIKTLSVPLDPERAAQALKRHFTRDELQRLVEALTSGSSPV